MDKELAIEKIREEDAQIGDWVSKCVDKGSFTSQDMLETLKRIKQAGYQLPPEQTDKREAVERLLDGGLSCSDGCAHFLDENPKRYLVSQILSLIQPPLKVLSEEEILAIYKKHNWVIFEPDLNRANILSQAQVDYNNRQLKGEL